MYEQAFTQFKEVLESELKRKNFSVNFIFKISGNHMEIQIPGYSGSHYEICFRQEYDELALHFQSTLNANMNRLNVLIPHISEMENMTGRKIKSGKLESKDWKRIWIEEPKTDLTTDTIRGYAIIMANFILSSYPYLQKAYFN